MDKVNILGVKVNRVSMPDVLKMVDGWLKVRGKHYIVTPNLEFIKDAQKDEDFKKILNRADLAIPDSSRLGWLYALSREENILKRLALFPLGVIPKLYQFDMVTGTDLMEKLCQLASKKGLTVGFLGGRLGVAEKASGCLQKKYQNLQVSYVGGAGEVSSEGYLNNLRDLDKTDILFVAFGHPKQEKWIAENFKKIPVKVAMGVGGAFDYFSGTIPRAPGFIRGMGFEWLFRLMMQPWRLKRITFLVIFLYSVLIHSTSSGSTLNETQGLTKRD